MERDSGYVKVVMEMNFFSETSLYNFNEFFFFFFKI